MQKKDLLNILHRLGIQALDITDNWVRVSCPLAEVTHASGSDRNPSAGFTVNDKGNSAFHCFVCGTRTMPEILHVFKWRKGVDLLQEYFATEVEEVKAETCYKEKSYTRPEPVAVPEHLLALFKPIKYAEAYLIKRGIALRAAERHGLRFCDRYTTPEGKTWKNAILTPIRDQDFKTYWLHFRSIESKFFWHAQPKHFGLDLEWGRDDSFFGMEYFDSTKPVTVVEGAFDVLRLESLGEENVLATHGGVSFKSAKLKRLAALNPVAVRSGFDSDLAGQTFTQALDRNIPKAQVLNWDIVGCKDAGELKTRQDLDKVLKQRNYKFQDKWMAKAHQLI